MNANEIKNRVWRFLCSAKDGETLPLTTEEYDALVVKECVSDADPMKAMG